MNKGAKTTHLMKKKIINLDYLVTFKRKQNVTGQLKTSENSKEIFQL